MSACHFLATIIEARRSGTLVPPAKIVNAIITGGIPRAVANQTPLSTRNLLKIIINSIDRAKVTV